MAKFRQNLPLGERLFISDGGLETTLIFHHGIELPYFASIVLLQDQRGQDALNEYFLRYVDLARRFQVGLVLDSATWRASPEWGRKLGLGESELRDLNRKAIELIAKLRSSFQTPASPMVINACIGPRGDGYVPAQKMSAEQAQAYHRFQIEIFQKTDADLISAITFNYAEEAIGAALAASAAGLPIVISFTVETNGRLPTGQTLEEAICQVDAETSRTPVYYMINCAHPSHFQSVLETSRDWTSRIGGIRANASRLSHAELDEAEELDEGNPFELAADYVRLSELLPDLKVVGGCCGTDHRHVEAVLRALKTTGFRQAARQSA